MADTIVAAFHSDSALYFYNNKTYTNDGEFLYTTLIINHKSFTGDNESSLIFHIHSISSPSTEFYYHVLHFIYEYLKLNPDDYFWIADNDWVYNWEDIHKLKSLPDDPDWCYKKSQRLTSK